MPKAYFQRFWNNYVWGEQRATNLEDPNTAINGFTLTELFGGSSADSGETVNETTAMTFSAVYRATAIITGIISSLPLKIYRMTDKSREEMRKHPYWPAITSTPNRYQTKNVFWERAINYYLNWGNVYARLKIGNSLEMELLHPNTLKGIDKNTRGNLVYTFMIDDQETPINQSKLIHIPNLGEGIVGMGVVEKARNDLGLELARRKYGNYYFKGGGKANAFISTDQILKDSQREEIANWVRKQKSLGNDLMLDSGFKYTPISIPPEDAQFLQTGEFSVETVARWYGVPKSKLASAKDPTFANAESLGIDFMQDTISPLCSKIEAELTSKLLDDNIYAEFDINAYLRADTAAKAEAYQKGIFSGYYTINEVRKKENLNPVEGGDEPLVQGAMMKLKSLDNDRNTQDMGGDQEAPGI